MQLMYRVFTVTILLLFGSGVLYANTYYLAPGGNDLNSGASVDSPWSSPNHSGLVCGDTITALPGEYAAMTVVALPTCKTHSAVFVRCAVFAACKIHQNIDTQGGILVQASYWAFLGWDVSVTGGQYAACFQATPTGPVHATIHDIYFINDIANGCMAGGFVSAPASPYGVDYFAVVADIAYNTTQGSAYCYSGVSVYQPVASDNLPGTHIYVAQVFSWHNVEPQFCAGGVSTDGEGVILDTFNGQQSGLPAYDQQAAIENVLTIFNGAAGILAGGGSGNSQSHMYVRHSTAYDNFINTTQDQAVCGQIQSVGYPADNPENANSYTEMSWNLAAVSSATRPGCGRHPAFVYFFGNVDATDSMYSNAGFSPTASNIGTIGRTGGFVAGPDNAFGFNPWFLNPEEPSSPSCSDSESVIACMTGVIESFTPKNVLLATYGYHAPVLESVYDPLFPKWLCSDQIPNGLVSRDCSASTTPARTQTTLTGQRYVTPVVQ